VNTVSLFSQGGHYYQWNTGNGNMQFYNNGAYRMIIDSSGNVGIGASVPAMKLESMGTNAAAATTGTAANGSLRLSGSGGTSMVLDAGVQGGAGAHTWLQATSSADLSQGYNLALNPNGGSVGIGTTSPASILSLGGTSSPASSSNTANYLSIYGDRVASDGDVGGINFYNNDGEAANDKKVAAVVAGRTGDNYGGSLSFLPSSNGVEATTRMYINNSGNVGIGFTSPAYRPALHSPHCST